MLRSLTMRAAYERFHLHALRADGAAVSTLQNYLAALAAWEQWGPRVELGGPTDFTRLKAGDLPPSNSRPLDVGEVRQSHLLEFKANMLAAGRAPATFDNYWRVLRAILATCVVEEVIGELPKTPRLKPTQTEQRDRPTPEEFGRLMEATAAAKWPVGPVPAPVIWRALLGVTYVTALRRGDVLSLTWDAVADDGIRWTPAKTRRHKKWVYCPELPGMPMRRLLAPLRGHGDRVFGMVPRNLVSLNATQRRIATHARVKVDRATFHPIRRASLDAWVQAAPEAAGLIAGHGLSLPRITRLHYVSPQAERERIEAVMWAAAERFPMPACLLKGATP